jgi:magnesium-transporting ATPase (P-type)
MAVTQRLALSSREAPAQTGLTSAEASALLAEYGPNVLAEAPRPSHFRLLTANLVHLFALLLWAGAGLAALAGMPELSVAIAAVVVVNAAFAFAQEYRAERAVEALRRMLPTMPASGAMVARSTSRRRVLSNRLLLAGIAFEIGLVAGLIYRPG